MTTETATKAETISEKLSEALHDYRFTESLMHQKLSDSKKYWLGHEHNQRMYMKFRSRRASISLKIDHLLTTINNTIHQ